MTQSNAVRYDQEIPEILNPLAGVHPVMDENGLARTLHHLVQLRASQINRCGFCVKMHTREAREDGETDRWLDRLLVWDLVSDFNARERAPLAWTEALTDRHPKTDLGALRAKLRAHFSEREIGVLTATVAMINFWNRINVSRH